MPIELFWDGAADEPEGEMYQKCVSATGASFLLAAGALMQIAARIPDNYIADELSGLLLVNAYDQRDALIHVARQLMKPYGCGDGGEMFMLRANPADPCQIEQSFDGGASWFLAFRTDNCIADTLNQINNTVNLIDNDTSITRNYTNTQNINNQYATYLSTINNLVTTYNNNVLNIYPQATYNGTPTDDDRNLALCWAVSRAVDTVCDGFISAINEAAQNRNETILLVGLITGVFIIGTIATAGTLALAAEGLGGVTGLAISGVGASAGIATWMIETIKNHSAAEFQDTAARETVKCVLYNQLKGVTISAANFAAALDAHGLSGNAGTIANAMDLANGVTENFVGFAALLRQSFAAVQSGIIVPENCPCDTFTPTSWGYEWDFATASASAVSGTTGTTLIKTTAGYQVTKNTTVYEGIGVYLGGGTNAGVTGVDKISAGLSINRVQMDIYRSHKNTTTNPDYIRIQTGATVTATVSKAASNATGNMTLDFPGLSWTFGTNPALGILPQIDNSPTNANLTMTVFKVRVYGSGSQPTGLLSGGTWL